MFGLFYIHNLTFFIHQNPEIRSPEYKIKDVRWYHLKK